MPTKPITFVSLIFIIVSTFGAFGFFVIFRSRKQPSTAVVFRSSQPTAAVVIKKNKQFSSSISATTAATPTPTLTPTPTPIATSTSSSTVASFRSIRKLNHRGILKALHWFDLKATKHQIQYRLAYGSLLGYSRDQRVIAHDTDIDIVISPQSMAILTALVKGSEEPHILDQHNHPALTGKNNQFTNNDDIVMLFRARNHHQKFTNIPRVDCTSRVRSRNVDACSFTGPVARVLHVQTLTFVDIFLTRCPYRGQSAQAAKQWHCRISSGDCSYCPSREAVYFVHLLLAGQVDSFLLRSSVLQYSRPFYTNGI